MKADVPGCPDHTWIDPHSNKEVRTKPCTGYCRIRRELEGKKPLTEFLKKLMGYKDEDLLQANAEKAARVYGINSDHAAGYIRMEVSKRGLRGEESRGLLADRKPGQRKRGKVDARKEVA